MGVGFMEGELPACMAHFPDRWRQHALVVVVFVFWRVALRYRPNFSRQIAVATYKVYVAVFVVSGELSIPKFQILHIGSC